ncbi:aldose epimerase family protein [Jiulongibacter sediminis]|uniref:Aldose 1-epimerase n=1 Tax=Jiulongibacter sediminis TaxID=1605367 RepID=A0A0P7BPU5_9BACT|nr:aldose epimerase family protein [Jiulongibacter sediminis]KPM47256.1 aldose epimerase [Jiulongibacter sediminis]TBX22814.1 aldose epimerase [Jiulongibacter sediminis]
MKKLVLLLALSMGFVACKNATTEESDSMTSSISEEVWGQLEDGSEASLFTLKNANGMTVTITNYGGKIVTWTAPDKDGNYENINLGMKTLPEYFSGAAFFGTLVGRFGNRIGGAKFTIDGEEYNLVANDGENSLHSSGAGIDGQLWEAEIVEAENPTLKLTTVSPDGAGGFPGNLSIEVVYTLQADDALKIDYKATTDKATHVNLTNHAYFNLSGMSENVLNHEVTIYADKYLPVDSGLIPFGEPAAVEGTPFDFTTSHAIGERINDTTDVQIATGGGYDHAWVFTDSSDEMKLGAEVYHPATGRFMQMYTTEPAVQFYTGNFLNGSLVGHDDVKYDNRWGFCLETEHFPDAPNKPEYASTLLRPGETYTTSTMYKFSTK